MGQGPLRKPESAAPRRPGRPPGDARDRVLAAATALFLELGYTATSIDRIAESAGVTKPTVYSYYSGKEALFRAIIEQRSEGLRTALQSPDLGAKPAAAALRAIGLHFLEVMLDPATLGLYRLMIAEAPKHPELAQVFYAGAIEPVHASLADLLHWLDAKAALRVANPREAAGIFFEMLKGDLFLQGLLGVDAPMSGAALQEHVSRGVAIFLKAYAPAEGAAARTRPPRPIRGSTVSH